MLNPVPIQNVEYQPLNLVNLGPINKFLGVTSLDPFNAPLGTAVSMKNLTAAGGIHPALSARNSFALLGGNIGSVTGLGQHMNTTLHAMAGGGWFRWSGSAWVSVVAGLSLNAQWSMTNFKGNLASTNLIAVNGVDTPRKFDGTNQSNLAGLPSGVNFKMIDQHTDRLYASDGKAVYYSAVAKPQDWTTVGESGAGAIQIETNTGEDVNAIKAGMKHLMVFKRNAFMELWGTRPSNYQLQRVSETGALGLNAVTLRDQTAYWASDGGAFHYTGGLPRKDFSVPVIGYFNAMNKAAASNACVTSTKDSVLFSIPTGASTVNDTTLEYLPDVGIWTVWKDFAPRAWTFWNGVLVYGETNGVFQQGTSATGTAWEWVSPPFGSGPYAGQKQWYKLWYVIDLPAGSSMTVSVSRKAEGDAAQDWITAQTINAGDNYPGDGYNPAGRPTIGRRVIIPVEQVANSNFLRVKFSGVGPVEFHELNIQQREMPLR